MGSENIQTGGKGRTTPNNLPGTSCLLGDEGGDTAKLALLILHEKVLGNMFYSQDYNEFFTIFETCFTIKQVQPL